MKLVISALAMLAVGTVYASFDLMLLPGRDNRIYRYDPVNRLMLGSYATSATGKIAANNAGLSYSTAGSSTLQVNEYSSGNHAGFLTTSSSNRGLELAGDSVYALSTSQLRKTVIANNNASILTLGTNVVWHTLASFGSNIVAIGTDTANQISFQNVDLNTFTAGSVITTINTATAGSNMGKAAAVEVPFSSAPTLMFTFMNGATPSIARLQLTASGAATSTAVTTAAMNNFSSTNFMPGFSAGHAGGFWAYGQDSITPTNARVTRYDRTSNLLVEGETNTFASPGGNFTSGIFHAANVVAPEPAAFMPLAMGLLLLQRRKLVKRKR